MADETAGRAKGGAAGPAPALDGLRGLAALMVFLSHASLAGLPLAPGLDFAGAGKPGVYLFFVLSAFLLTRNALAGGAGAFRPEGLVGYASRRVIRIFPAYAAYLLFAFTATAALSLVMETPRVSPFPLDAAGLLAHLALLRGEGVTWSIAVEMKAYAILPLAAFALLAAGRRGPGALAAATALLLAAAAWAEASAAPAVNDMRLAPYATLFAAGAALAAWEGAILSRLRSAAAWIGLAAAIAAALTLPALHAALTGAPTASDAFHGAHALYAALWSAVLIGVLAARTGAAALSWPPLRAMGRVSFSFYLWHVVAIAAVKALAPGAAGGALALALALALAALSWRLIERPCLALGRADARRRPCEAQEARPGPEFALGRSGVAR